MRLFARSQRVAGSSRLQCGCLMKLVYHIDVLLCRLRLLMSDPITALRRDAAAAAFASSAPRFFLR